MKKIVLYLLLVAATGCNQLDRFHDNQIALDVEYVSVLLDNVHKGESNKDMEVFRHYFITDSTLIWTHGAGKIIGKGWDGFMKDREKGWQLADSIWWDVNDRVINIDDLGKVAWFAESVNLNYEMGDTVIHRYDVLISGVLQKLGQNWKVVQFHETGSDLH